eukprot:gene15491-11082_t
MSFGRHFLPADYVKPYADIGKFYDELIEKEIRSKITAPDPVLHRLTQEAGRRFELGVDADAVKEHVKSQVVRETAKRQQAKDAAASSAALYSPPAKTLDEPTYRDEKPFEIHHSHYNPPPKGKLSLTDVVHSNNAREGGRFHRRDVVDVYAPHFEAAPADNAYAQHTPKVWPKATEQPVTAATLRRLEDDGVPTTFASLSTLSRHSGSPLYAAQDSRSDTRSALTRTSTKTKTKLTQRHDEALRQATDTFQAKLRHHVDWLDAPCDGNDAKVAATLSSVSLRMPTDASLRKRMQLPPSDATAGSAAEASRTRRRRPRHTDTDTTSVALMSTATEDASWPTHRSERRPRSLPALDASATTSTQSRRSGGGGSGAASLVTTSTAGGSHRSAATNATSDDPNAVQLAALHLTTLHDTLNPFRRRHDYHARTTHVRYAQRRPHRVRATDPLDYKDDVLLRATRGAYNAVTAPPPGYEATPSRREVTQTLLQLTRKQILHYHARVVELGVLVRVLSSAQTHATPGLDAVFTLHAACIRAAGVHTNPFVLRKHELFRVIQQHATGTAVPDTSVSRLLLCFDTTNTGLIRYVRVTLCALVAMDTARLQLAVALEAVPRRHLAPYVHVVVFRAHDSKHHRPSSSSSSTAVSVSLTALRPSGMSQMDPPDPLRHRLRQFAPYAPHDTADDAASVLSELTGHCVSGVDATTATGGGSVAASSTAPPATASASSSSSVVSAASDASSSTAVERNAEGYAKLSEAEWRDWRGELLLLQLCHQLFCECRGFVFAAATRLQARTDPLDPDVRDADVDGPSRANGDGDGVGDGDEEGETPRMRLEDIAELFSGCAASGDDELTMQRLVLPLQQWLFQRLATVPAAFLSCGRPLPASMATADSLASLPSTVSLSPGVVDIATILKHPELRTLFASLTVSWRLLLRGVLLHTELLREFVRQTRAFRQAVHEAQVERQQAHARGPTDIGEAIAHFARDGAHVLSPSSPSPSVASVSIASGGRLSVASVV